MDHGTRRLTGVCSGERWFSGRRRFPRAKSTYPISGASRRERKEKKEGICMPMFPLARKCGRASGNDRLGRTVSHERGEQRPLFEGHTGTGTNQTGRFHATGHWRRACDIETSSSNFLCLAIISLIATIYRFARTCTSEITF